MEEKLFSALTATAQESDLLALREESARELAPYREPHEDRADSPGRAAVPA